MADVAIANEYQMVVCPKYPEVVSQIILGLNELIYYHELQ